MLAVAAALAAPLEVGGDVKLFFLAGDSRPWFAFSEESVATLDLLGLTEDEALEYYGLDAPPFAQGVASARLKLALVLDPVRVDAHWAGAASTASAAGLTPGLGTGTAEAAPELLPLTWEPDTGDGVALRHRLDRLVVSVKAPHLDLALGRQPVSFGTGRIFTPMDLVNPFHPATIDTEYKPGVDALRADVYAGVTTRFTAVGAWAGKPVVGEGARDPDRDVAKDLVVAATGQTTVGVTDLLLFAGDVRSELVFGLGTTSSIGAVGVHAEATVTLADEPFVRAVAGADGRPAETTTVMGEAYLQSFGATDPADYLDALDDPRFRRGEVWEMGQLYAAVAVVQEITPLIHVNGSVISNLRDPSALVSLGGSWSVSDNSDVVFGGYAGLGAPPDTVELDLALDPATMTPTVTYEEGALERSVNSEFGLYPAMGYVQVRAYF